MQYWLVKSDADTWSWDDQWSAPKRTTNWDGVRNYQAANNLKAMSKGDLALFYHSGKDKAVVGVVRIVKEYYPDPSDDTGKGFGQVDVKAVAAAKTPVTLKQIKATPSLKDIALIRQSRLSVMPVTKQQWGVICEMAGIEG